MQHPACDSWQQRHYDEPAASPLQLQTEGGVVRPERPRGRERDAPQRCVFDYVLEAIDPCASLYTPTQKIDATNFVRHRLFNFVSSEAYKELGPKKSRVLSVWLSGNPSKEESRGIVLQFLQFLLDEKAPSAISLNRRGHWFVS